jgi:hypothetical protein
MGPQPEMAVPAPFTEPLSHSSWSVSAPGVPTSGGPSAAILGVPSRALALYDGHTVGGLYPISHVYRSVSRHPVDSVHDFSYVAGKNRLMVRYSVTCASHHAKTRNLECASLSWRPVTAPWHDDSEGVVDFSGSFIVLELDARNELFAKMPGSPRSLGECCTSLGSGSHSSAWIGDGRRHCIA